jgi:methionyl-tRNA synthetase
VRFYLLHAIPTGRDGEFTLEHVRRALQHAPRERSRQPASRTLTMVHKYFGGVPPAEWDPASLQDPLRARRSTR